MRQERIQKATVRRRPREVEAWQQPAAPAGPPDLSDIDEVLALIESALSAA